MSEADIIAVEQLMFWKREGWLAKQCLIALGRHHRGGWRQVFTALVREAGRMQEWHQ